MLSRRASVFYSSSCMRCNVQLLLKRWNSETFKLMSEEKKKKREELEKNLMMGHEIWRPAKRLTWYQIEHLRTLKKRDPEEWSNTKLSHFFGISISAVVRILRSKFEPPDEVKERQDNKAKELAKIRHTDFKKKLFQSHVGGYVDGGDNSSEPKGTEPTIQDTFRNAAERKVRTESGDKINGTWRSAEDNRGRIGFRDGSTVTTPTGTRTEYEGDRDSLKDRTTSMTRTGPICGTRAEGAGTSFSDERRRRRRTVSVDRGSSYEDDKSSCKSERTWRGRTSETSATES